MNIFHRKKERVLQLIRLARIKFPLCGLFVFIFGVMLGLHSGGSLEFVCISLCGLSVFCAQLAVSFSNDYFDYFVDRFTTPTLISGGSGVLQNHPELRPVAIRAAWLLTSASLIFMIFVIVMYNVSLLFGVFVIAANVLGWSYSAPPIRLVDRGLGELLVTGITGIMLPLLGFISTKTSFSILIALFLFPALVYAAVFIVLVEIPDIEADKKGKKPTVVTRLGQRWSFNLTFLLLAGNIGYFLWLSTLPLSFFPLDIIVITGLSIMPFIAMIVGYNFTKKGRQFTTQLAVRGIISLVSYLVLLDIYLLYSL